MIAPSPLMLSLIPAAYLVGSIPFGLLVGLSRGVDPRKAGSGNIGATNVGRLLGGKYFALVFTLDLIKGLVPTATAGFVLQNSVSHTLGAADFAAWLAVAFAAILGHMYSIFLGFKGGKGVATSAGVILGIYPFFTTPGGVTLAVWLAVFFLTRYVSLASICAAIGFTASYIAIGLTNHWDIFHQQLPLLIFSLLVAALIVIKHRANVSRLLAGTEPRAGAKPQGNWPA